MNSETILLVINLIFSIVLFCFLVKSYKLLPKINAQQRKDDMHAFANQNQSIKSLQEQLSRQQLLLGDLKDMFDGLSRVVERINDQMMADALKEQAKKDDPLGR